MTAHETDLDLERPQPKARIYRAGLDFPPAVAIRSAPGPSQLSYTTLLGPPNAAPGPDENEDGYNDGRPGGLPHPAWGRAPLLSQDALMERALRNVAENEAQMGQGQGTGGGRPETGEGASTIAGGAIGGGANMYGPTHSYGQIPRVPKEVIWREWNTNPSLHGPAKLTRPPIFVASTQSYDELGRSVSDGVGVDVLQGAAMGEHGDEGDEEGRGGKVDGEDVKGWYLSLAKPPTQLSSSTKDNTFSAVVEAIISSQRAVKNDRNGMPNSNTTLIDLTSDSDEETSTPKAESSDTTQPNVNNVGLPTSADPVSTSGVTVAPPSLKIHSRDWFIRRALLRQHQSQHQFQSESESQTSPTTGSSPFQASAAPRTTTISSMLDISSASASARLAKRRRVEPTYVLGPENVGYTILKERLGWGGGGLGRLTGWTDKTGGQVSGLEGISDGKSGVGDDRRSAGSDSDPRRGLSNDHSTGVKNQVEGAQCANEAKGNGINAVIQVENRDAQKQGKGKIREQVVELDENGRPIVDLTLSDSESESASDCDFNPRPEAQLKAKENSGSHLDSMKGTPDPNPLLERDLEAEVEAEAEVEPNYGPGRTAPIATRLKLDRLGLGHRHSKPKPVSNSGTKTNHNTREGSGTTSNTKNGSCGSGSGSRGHHHGHNEKKVTHTQAEIEYAQRRAKYGSGYGHGKGLELGKKGKVKWKEHDRRERDERRRLAAALNS